METKIFETAKKSIERIIENNNKINFVIPTYQRPYVWEDEEVLKLLQDIYNACQHEQKNYFIGNVYITSSIQENTFDVIDGQQRFTTIWLIALVFKQLNIESNIINFLGNENNPLLNFTIRTEVEHYLKSLIQEKNQVFTADEITKNEFLKNIAKAIETIRGFITPLTEHKKLADYIYKNVLFVYNTVPKNTDLNSLFTALGNSGVQLEQTDILKSQLLKLVDDKVLCAKMWEACENMNDYFENNVLAIFSKTDRTNIKEDPFLKFDGEIFVFENNPVENNPEKKPQTIANIIASSNIQASKSTTAVENEKDKKKMRCRSIIPFSVLLLHTYRIFLYQNNQDEKQDFEKPFDKKHLLEIFGKLVKEPNKINEFFVLLWKVRYLFDKHIIKWRFDNENEENSDTDEKLRLTKLSKIENSFARQNESHSAMSMLQSVLYFTNGFNQQYWLTPFLNYLLQSKEEENILTELEKIDNYLSLNKKSQTKEQKEENILTELEKIDNYLSLSVNTQKEASRALMKETEILIPNFDILKELEQLKGTGFKHYWFYKLEYILWKQWNNKDEKDEKFKKYRITSKNSVEHVFPQNPESGITPLENEALHSFGNLALLSVGQNSSFGNQSVDKKRIDFQNQHTYQSLKLAKIYACKRWEKTEIQIHQEEMIKLLEEHQKEMIKLLTAHCTTK